MEARKLVIAFLKRVHILFSIGGKKPTKQTNKKHMKKYTFSVYSPILKKEFINSEYFTSEANFRLYALALYSGNWSLISVE
jgi:hypothetical protein